MFKRLHDSVRGWLAAPWFFYIIVGLLVLQALWIALTARYPQAFDENFHFGLIQLHAQQWLPFFTQHPPGAEIYGAVTRDPSYFYHYLMSLPYRLLALFTDSEMVQVIVLRLLNIGLFVWGLYVFRKLLLAIGASRPMMHTVLLFFVLTPIVPLLAAQINYDNALVPLTGLVFLALVRLMQDLKNRQVLSVNLLLLFVFYGMLASIIKYTFTPLLFASVVALAVAGAWHWRRGVSRSRQKPRLTFQKSAFTYLLIPALLVLGLLFVERYGINLARYQSPSPDCGQVLTTEQCRQYAPWGRDYLFDQWNQKPSAAAIQEYPTIWTEKMVWETMFTVSSWFNESRIVQYYTANPLPLAYAAAWLILAAGLLLSVVFWRQLWRMRGLSILLLIITFYVAVLFAKNFSMFMHTAVPVAIHGRYLIPVFPIIFLILALGFARLFESMALPRLKAWMVIVVALLMIQGGGITVWIVRSDPRWYWQDNQAAEQVNWWAKNALRPILIEEAKWIDITEPKPKETE